MAKYIRVETSTTGRKRYIYACEKCGSEVWRYTRSNKRIICGNCRKSEEREKQKLRQVERIEEAYDKGYRRAIDNAFEYCRKSKCTYCGFSIWENGKFSGCYLERSKEQKQIE